MTMRQWKIATVEEWSDLIDDIVDVWSDKHILLLRGDLGAGKTTLVKQLMAHLGSTDEVSSPTFSIINEYVTSRGAVYHMDLYRLKDEAEAIDIGIEEYLDSGELCVIEWPELIVDLLPEEYCEIQIEVDEMACRTITIH